MDKRKFQLILLGIGILILFVGIVMAVEFSPMNEHAQTFYDRNWDELTAVQQTWLSVRFPDLALAAQRKEQQKKWLITWILKPIILFIVLTAAIVASQVIRKRVIPHPEGNKKSAHKLNRK